MTSIIVDTLERYGAAARRVLFDYLPTQGPGHRLYEYCRDYPSRGGRALRPSLCIATACAYGSPVEAALCTAASIELMHNAMLIHDDIEDESELRRGTPALHVKVGVPIAINVGDALSLISFRPLVDNRRLLGEELAMKILEAAHDMARESAEGQAIELQWRRDNPSDITEADYLNMVLKKTCWLTTIFPMVSGALIGSRGRADVLPLMRFGYLLGAAFQVQDDLLNLIGDGDRYGKERSGDIYEGKRTIMLIRLFALGSADERRRLSAMLGKPRDQRGAGEVRWVRDAMEAYDCIAYAQKFANGLAGAAQHEFETSFALLPEGADKQFIAALSTWVIART